MSGPTAKYHCLYCPACPWEETHDKVWAMANRCPECGSHLRFINYDGHEQQQAQEIKQMNRLPRGT